MTGLAARAVVGGRYRLEERAGRGGMSEVWLATDERLGRKVAVKLLEPTVSDLDLEREAGIVSRLRHNNIVAVYDAGTDEGRRFIVMEWVEGRSLRAALQQTGTRTPAEAAHIGAGVAAALAYAHSRGVVHNDVKPENILIDSDGQPRLADFGVARITGATLAPGEATEVLGTIAYVAPEVLQGAPGDERSDVYALATALYEAVSGRLPFDAPSNAALAAQKLNARPRPLAGYAPSAPAALTDLIDGGLAFAPPDRPAATLMRDALSRIAKAPRGQAAGAAAVGAVAALPHQPTRRLFAAPAAMPDRRRKALAMVATAAAGLVALTAFAFASRDGDDGGASGGPGSTVTEVAAAGSAGSATPTPSRATPVPSEDGDDDDEEDD